MCSHVLGFMWCMFCKVRGDCLILSIFKRETQYHEFIDPQPFQFENNLFANQKVLTAAFKYFVFFLRYALDIFATLAVPSSPEVDGLLGGSRYSYGVAVPWQCLAGRLGHPLERWTQRGEATLYFAAAYCNTKPPFPGCRHSLDTSEEPGLFLRVLGFMVKTKWVLNMQTYLQDETVIIPKCLWFDSLF